MTKPPPNLVISACAGSGKTYALIQRLLLLLENGAAPGDILAITFTRKAAAEIKTRLLDALRARASGGEAWAARCLRRLLLAEDAKDELNIHTFHGWFGVLLAGRRWSKDWYGPPELTEDDSPLRRIAWRRWIEKAVSAAKSDTADAWNTALSHCSPYTLQQLFTGALVHHHNAWRLSPPPPPPPNTVESEQQLRTALTSFAAAVGQGNKTTATAHNAITDFLATNSGSSDSSDALSAVEKALLTAAGTLRVALRNAIQKNTDAKIADEAENALQHHATLMAECRTLAFHAQVEQLARGYLREFESLKSERNQLSFDDLEFESHRAVEAHGDVNTMLYRLNQRFRHLLIDEFQDTSPLQWQIIRHWLYAAHGSEGGDTAPSVFIVGDAKQAIYRFRHGDARLLTQAQEFLRDYYNAELREEDICRRCSPVVLQLVNAVFAQRSGELTPDMPFPPYVAHKPGEPNATLPGRVEWREIGDDGDDKTEQPTRPRIRNPLHTKRAENDKRQRWAEAVAQQVRTVIGNWKISDTDTEGKPAPRRATAEDVLILLPQFTHAARLQQALQRQGIPVSVHGGGKGFASTLACQDIAALARVLLSPDNSLSLAQVLKSPLFAFTEEQLADVAEATQTAQDNNLWSGLCAATDSTLQNAAATLQRWRGWALQGTLPAHDLLMRVFTDGNVLARYRAAVAPPYRRQVTADLSALLDFSLHNNGGCRPLLAQFIDSLDTAMAAASGGSGVRLMTVHGAKGLEAPIVVLADCTFGKRHSGGGRESVELLIDWPPESAAPARFIFRPSTEKRAFADISAHEDMIGEREYDNLFYVALTRARQGLIIFSLSSSGPGSSSNPRLEALQEVMQTTLPTQEEDGALTYGDSLIADESVPAATATAEAQTPPATHAPTTLPPEGEIMNDAIVMAGRHGDLLHRQVALLALGTDEQTVRRITAADISDAQQLLATDALQQLLQRAVRIDAEAEFVQDGRTLRLDLLIDTGDVMWIIDYKTGSGKLERHAQQMDNYLAVIRAVYPDKPARAAFVTPKGFFPHEG